MVAGEDPVLGEVGVAFVVAVAGESAPSLEEIRSRVALQLADYKAPDAVVVLDELPVTPMGKVDKRALKPLADEAAAERSRVRAAARSQDGRSTPSIGQDGGSTTEGKT